MALSLFPRYAFVRLRPLTRSSTVSSTLQPQYLGLEQLCQDFAVELLGMCRNQSEVTTILNSCFDEGHEDKVFEEGIPNLSRLRLAVNYNQKLVLTHTKSLST